MKMALTMPGSGNPVTRDRRPPRLLEETLAMCASHQDCLRSLRRLAAVLPGPEPWIHEGFDSARLPLIAVGAFAMTERDTS